MTAHLVSTGTGCGKHCGRGGKEQGGRKCNNSRLTGRSRWLKSAAHGYGARLARLHTNAMKRAPLLSKQHAQASERGPRRATGGLDEAAGYLLRCKYGSLVSIVRELWRRSSKVGAAPHPNAFLSQPDSTVRGGSTRGPSKGGATGLLPMTAVLHIMLQSDGDPACNIW